VEPKIISLGVAAPQYAYSQQQVFDALQYPRPFWRIFRDSGINARQFCIPIERIRCLSFQEQQEVYRDQATALSQQAIINCLDGRSVHDIGCLVFCSCTGFAPGPTIGHYLAKELGLARDVSITNISSMGCESGGFPGLRRAADFVKTTGRQALVVSCELCSLTYYPETGIDPANDYELLRANAVFGDFASAALVGTDTDPRHPCIVDSESYTETGYLGDLGYAWSNGRLRVLLSKRVPARATEVSAKAITSVLARHDLGPEGVAFWVIHAGGMKILDMIAQELGFPEHRLESSREFLRAHGNCSSATVGGVAKMLMQTATPHEGDYLAVVTVGPGMTGGCTLLRFEQ